MKSIVFGEPLWASAGRAVKATSAVVRARLLPWRISRRMRSVADQYRIIAGGAGWVERRDRGRLRFSGRDAARFLQGLVTNDVLALGPGQRACAAYLTPQGRMIADLTMHHRGDHLLVEVPAAHAAALSEQFDQLIFTEEVRVSDDSAAIAQLLIIGERAGDAIGRLQGDGATASPNAELDLPGFDLFVEAGRRDSAIAVLESAGTVAVSGELIEALRVEAGRPAFGIDMTAETIPLEAGLLDRAISTTKGCYVGQEVIVRVLHRGGGRVAKRLMKLRIDAGGATPPAAGTALHHEGRDVGRITSAAVSPRTGRVVALGYVHRERAEPGGRLSLPAEAGGHDVEIVGFAG